MNFKVAYFGTWGYGRAGLLGLLSIKNVDIVKVYTKFDPNSTDPYLNQVQKLAEENNLNIINTSKDVMDKKIFNEIVIQDNDIDFIISCCYDRIFSRRILEVPKILPINVHPSLLPKYRGIKPLENAIVNGEEKTGITIHELTDELDAGDILLQKDNIIISDEMTYKQLYDMQCELIIESINQFFTDPFSYVRNKNPQNHKNVSMAPRLGFEIQDNDAVRSIKNRY